ncbi:MAG: type VI secretion system tip protein VgrG [Chitinophagaceae bacterium]|nr:type VI secretion system tip protein VgrG [Chitinophagaceae bacterium]
MAVASFLDSFTIEQDTDLVSFEIRIDGSKISGAFHIVSMTIAHDINKVPSAQLLIRDGSASEENFAISDEEVFITGKKIEIELGYHNKNKPIFKGVIITNSHRVNSHCCEMTIDCKDERVNMTSSLSGNNHLNKSDFEIVGDLLRLNKLPEPEKPVLGNEIRHEQLVQSNTSDWDFMVSRLDVAGLFSFVDNGELFIKKPVLNADPVLHLKHGVNIFEFQADIDSRVQSPEVKTKTWDYQEQEVRTTDNDDPAEIDQPTDSEEEKSLKTTIDQIAAVLNKAFLIRGSYMTSEEQQLITNSKRIRQVLSRIKGKVKFQGTVRVRPGDFVKLSGVGKEFNGNVFVSGIHHDYADGCWFTEAILGWDESFFAEATNPKHAASTSGQISTIQGLHIGIVTSLIDPNGQFRVKVRLPLVNESDEGVYARIATLDAGNDRGSFFLPEVDDEVIVGFMNDDPRHPVILGMLHSAKKSSPNEPKDSNPQKGYKSRSGIRLIFDDEKKSVLIETPGNRMAELNDESGTITIKDPNGNKIIMDKNGITLESTAKDIKFKAKKSIKLEAQNIIIKASGDASMDAGGKAIVKAGGQTVVKGGTVMIN